MNSADAVTLENAYKQSELVVRQPAPSSLPYPGLLHNGEAESIRLAIELQADWLLVDDLDARQIAQTSG